MQTQKKCIIILSSKSSGSSALQNFLTKFPHVNHVSKTRHGENETLYWTKAASVLGMPQDNMLDSEVPLGQRKAKADLINFLCDNLDSYTPPPVDEELIFNGWKLLCEKYSPVFLEKSPHHLHQWSALELIADCIKRLPEVEFLIIGLIRNPMDTLYSKWRRWRSIPEKYEKEWLTAYENLLKFKKKIGEKLQIIKYEDIVRNHSYLREIFEFIGSSNRHVHENYLHGQSIQKWKNDKSFGFKLSKEVIQLAEKFGYNRSAMVNEGNSFWPFFKYISRVAYLSSKFVKSIILTLLKPMHRH